MKENILEQILHAESEYNQMIGNVAEQVEAYKRSIENKRGDELRALGQERLAIEESLNAKFLQAYAENEEAMTVAIEKQKDTLLVSKKRKSGAIVERLKNEILAEFFRDPPDSQFGEGGA